MEAVNEHDKIAVTGFWMVCCVIVLAWASVRGCATVYDPASLRADADARIRLYQAFKDPSPRPSP